MRTRTEDRQPAEADYSYRARGFPDDGKPKLKGTQLAIDEWVEENPKAKNVTPQRVIDLSFLPLVNLLERFGVNLSA